MQFSKWTMGVGMLLGTLLPVSAEAQVVKNDKLLSFEDPQIPVFISGTDSRLEISDEHYKDGLQSLSWTFNPGAVLSIKKDLKFEKKDPTGKDTYLSAFIVWVYNEQAQDKKIEFEFLKDGKKCTSFPFGINFTGWRAAWVCYERDMVGTPEEGMNEIRIEVSSTLNNRLMARGYYRDMAKLSTRTTRINYEPIFTAMMGGVNPTVSDYGLTGTMKLIPYVVKKL